MRHPEKEKFSQSLVEVENEISALTLEIVCQNNLLFVSLAKLAKMTIRKMRLEYRNRQKILKITDFHDFFQKFVR